MQPFAITLFAKTGDPRGIRHVDKTNWSGHGVVFTREQVNLLKSEPGYSQAGVYILTGNAAEETIYIGEADPVGERLKNHVANKDGWVWGVYFFDVNNKIGKTEVQYLESALVALAQRYGRAILLNKTNPTEPTMAPAARAMAQAFLADILLILPMLGINAFSEPEIIPPESQAQTLGTDGDPFDTIVVPAREEGFQDVFLGQQCWYAVRINAKHISRLKYIAAYRVAPIAAITHIAEVLDVVPYDTTGKYLIKFRSQASTIGPIQRSGNSKVNMQSPRYTLRDALLKAHHLDEVWN